MPRKLELQAEENVVSSPLRRSSRINVATVPSTLTSGKNPDNTEVKGTKTRRASLSQENADKDDKKENKPAPRARRGSAAKEETDVKPEPAKLRTRRASAEPKPSEPTTKAEEPKPISKRRRSSATEQLPQPDAGRTLRGRRSSFTGNLEENNEIKNENKKVVKGRRSSTEDASIEEPVKRPVRSRRNSAQSDESNLEAEKEKKRPTRGRRASTEKLEEEPEPKNVRLTPSKSKRRLSVTENVINLEPIEEQELETKGRKSNSPETKDLQVVLNYISPKEELDVRLTRSTPVKSKRRLSLTENAVNLDSIKEHESGVEGRKSRSPTQPELKIVLTSPHNKHEVEKESALQSKFSKDESGVTVASEPSVPVTENDENFSQADETEVAYSPKSEKTSIIVTPSKKSKYGDIRGNLNLSVIEENSFVDESFKETDNDKESPKHSPKPKTDLKPSPETPRKSPRLVERTAKSEEKGNKTDDTKTDKLVESKLGTPKKSPKTPKPDVKSKDTNGKQINMETTEITASNSKDNIGKSTTDTEESINNSVKETETVDSSEENNTNTVPMSDSNDEIQSTTNVEESKNKSVGTSETVDTAKQDSSNAVIVTNTNENIQESSSIEGSKTVLASQQDISNKIPVSNTSDNIQESTTDGGNLKNKSTEESETVITVKQNDSVSKTNDNIQESTDKKQLKNKSNEGSEHIDTSKDDSNEINQQDAEIKNSKEDFPDISMGSDGSFKFHLNVSLPSTNSQNLSQDSDIEDIPNTSNNSNTSNKENIELNILDKQTNIEVEQTDVGNPVNKKEIIRNEFSKNSTKENVESNTPDKQTNTENDVFIDRKQSAENESQKVPVARISNVFRPKMKENSFMEPMEVDEISYIQDMTVCKLSEELNNSSAQNFPAAKSTPIAAKKNIELRKDVNLKEQKKDVNESITMEEADSTEESFQLNLSVTQIDEVEFNAVNLQIECSVETVSSEECVVKSQTTNKDSKSEECSETVTSDEQPSESVLYTKSNSNDSCDDNVASITEIYEKEGPQLGDDNTEKSKQTESNDIPEDIEMENSDTGENMSSHASNDQIINESITSITVSINAKSPSLEPLVPHSQLNLTSEIPKDNAQNSLIQAVDKPDNEVKNLIQDKPLTPLKTTNETSCEQEDIYEENKSPTPVGTSETLTVLIPQVIENEKTQPEDTVSEEMNLEQHESEIDISDNVNEESTKAEASDEYEFEIPSDEEEIEKTQEIRSDDKSDNEDNIEQEQESPKTNQSDAVQVNEVRESRIEDTEIVCSNRETDQKQGHVFRDELKEIDTKDKKLNVNIEHNTLNEILPSDEEATAEETQNCKTKSRTDFTSLDKQDHHSEEDKSNHISSNEVEEKESKTDQHSNVNTTKESEDQNGESNDESLDKLHGHLQGDENNHSLGKEVENRKTEEHNDEVTSQIKVDVDTTEILEVEKMMDDFKDIPKHNSGLKEKSKSPTESFKKGTKTKKNKKNTLNETVDNNVSIESIEVEAVLTKSPKNRPKKVQTESDVNELAVNETVIEKSPKIKKSNNKSKINEESKKKSEDHPSQKTDPHKRNSSNILQHFANPALDEYITKKFAEMDNREPSDDETSELQEDSEQVEEESDQEKNEFISTMAEEGEEDTPSEGSNDIIDEGESINSTDSEIESEDDYDEDDSFICDEEQAELLSGEEYDLGYEKNIKKKKSRIIQLDDCDDDVIRITRKEKEPTIKKKKSRIITISDSSDNEEEKQSELEEPKETSNVVVEPSTNSPTSQLNVSQDDSESVEIQETDDEEILEEEETEAVVTGESPEDVYTTNESEDENQSCKNKRKSSITIHENINVSEIRDAALSERISNLVDTFCTSIRKGEISMNLSLECEVKDSSEDTEKKTPKKQTVSSPSDNVFNSEEEIPKKKSLKRKQKKGKTASRKRIKTDESGTSQEDMSHDRTERLSVTLDDLEEPGGSQKKLSKKRRISKSLEDISEKVPNKKKKGKQNWKHLVSKRKVVDTKTYEEHNRSSSEDDLKAQTYSIMDQLITDVKNRPIRTIIPSKSTTDLNSSWITEVADVRPSTTATSRRERTEYKALAKIHPKDFRSQMLYDSSRVKRVETKTLLRKKGAYV